MLSLSVAAFLYLGYYLLMFFYCRLYAGMFKESQLWQVHSKGSAGGAYAASLEVPPPAAGTVL